MKIRRVFSTFVLILDLVFISTTSSAGDIYKCNINGKITYSSVPCPGSLGTDKEEMERREAQARERERREAQAREREEKKRINDAMAKESEKERMAAVNRRNVESRDDKPVDCYALSRYAEAKGHNWIERSAIVSDAKSKGMCKY